MFFNETLVERQSRYQQWYQRLCLVGCGSDDNPAGILGQFICSTCMGWCRRRESNPLQAIE